MNATHNVNTKIEWAAHTLSDRTTMKASLTKRNAVKVQRIINKDQRITERLAKVAEFPLNEPGIIINTSSEWHLPRPLNDNGVGFASFVSA